MLDNYDISPAEWEIMRVVWANEPVSGRQIIDHTCQNFAWKEGTVKSMISRLIKKGALIKDESTRPAQLRAAFSQEEANQDQVDKIFSRVCSKNQGQLISYLIDKTLLSKDDLELIQEKITQKNTSAPQSVPCNCRAGQCACQKGGCQNE